MDIWNQFQQQLAFVCSTKELEQLKIEYLGKKGYIQEQMQRLKQVSAEERPRIGKEINDLRIKIEQTLEVQAALFTQQEEQQKLEREVCDISLPGRAPRMGSKHPIEECKERLLSIFSDLGFSVQVGPELDQEYYNFDVLNFAPDHPAKDMQDTFYVAPHLLLRTHATTIQGRFLEKHTPPVRIVCPGRCFRNETISSRSHVFFHQIDGLYVDEGVSIKDLTWTITEFVKRHFGPLVAVRFRPSYFPFVEPGLEVDIGCYLCKQSGCSVCKQTGWLEILGAGMIHPQVLKNVGIDPEKYSGFAWGLGIERMLMLQTGVRDIRLFSENDQRFLQQFQHV